MRNKTIEVIVGLFMMVGMLGLLVLAFKVSGLSPMSKTNYYELKSQFDDIGGLKVRAPVAVSGVTIGRVKSIDVDQATFRALVILQIEKKFNQIPIDTAASIYTQGLLGSNYIALTPGFDDQILKPGGMIKTTHSALILENLIGQLLFNLNSSKKSDKSKDLDQPKAIKQTSVQ